MHVVESRNRSMRYATMNHKRHIRHRKISSENHRRCKSRDDVDVIYYTAYGTMPRKVWKNRNTFLSINLIRVRVNSLAIFYRTTSHSNLELLFDLSKYTHRFASSHGAKTKLSIHDRKNTVFSARDISEEYFLRIFSRLISARIWTTLEKCLSVNSLLL
jgi:hypothetical protein